MINRDLIKDLEECKKEKELIKNKLLNLILDYDEISNDNWNMGLSEAVESIHEDVEDLFKNPYTFQMQRFCDDCKYYLEVDYNKGNCDKLNKSVDGNPNYCEEFEWKI